MDKAAQRAAAIAAVAAFLANGGTVQKVAHKASTQEKNACRKVTAQHVLNTLKQNTCKTL